MVIQILSRIHFEKWQVEWLLYVLWVQHNETCSTYNLFRIQEVYANDWTFRLSFHKTWDFHVYIHSPGDEIWLSFLAFPFQLVYFRLNTNNSDGMKVTDVSISEKEIVTLAKEGLPCKSYVEMVRFNSKTRPFLYYQI